MRRVRRVRRVLGVLLVLMVPSVAAAQESAKVPEVTEADRQAAFPDVHGHAVHDTAISFKALFDQLEWQYIHGKQGLRWDNNTWIGGDVHRFWIKSEGEAVDGIVDDGDVRLLYGRSFSRWWEWVAGVRHDFQPDPQHTWFTAGLHGLAPQWFEIDAMASIGPNGHTSARLEVEYEALMTNRLVLQPLVELSFAGKDDPDRGIGAGLSTGEVGFRLRYELRRGLAPYVGLVWHRKLFGTGDYASAAGDDVGGWHVVVGVRTWF